jgi:hypothetical protein
MKTIKNDKKNRVLPSKTNNMTKHMRPPVGVKSKPIALLVSAMLMGAMSFAQSIHFNYTDGTNASYSLEDVRKITYDADVMSLHLWDGSLYAWNVSTIGYYQYDESSLDIQELLNNANEWEVNIFPNPTSATLYVSFNLPQSDEVSIKLYDMQGKLIITRNIGIKETGEHQEVIDLTDIPMGTYTCSISGQKNLVTKQLIKH